MVEWHPMSAKDLSQLHQFGKKVLPGKFLGYVLHAVRIWEGDTLVADIEELEKMDASEIHATRLNAKEVFTPQNDETLIFLVEDGTVKLSGGDQFWQHPVPREASFPTPLKCIDVTRATSTSLDVMLENYRRLLERWWKSRIVRYVTGVYKVHDIEWDTTRRENLVREATDKEADDIQARLSVARNMERHVRSVEAKRKAKEGYRKTEAWQCQKFARYLLHWSSGWGIRGNCEKCA